MMRAADVAVVGAGVMGVAIAAELKRRDPGAHVVVLDKEPAAGAHASGRNSGVLHAGFYYTADSLKARFTRNGNAAMRAWCERHGLRLNRCGKLVVARDAGDLAGLDELLRRARVNGVELESVTAEETRSIEPRARTFERALWSPTTATVDATEVMTSLVSAAERDGVEFRYGVACRGLAPGRVRTTGGDVTAGFVVNAAGLYADRLARTAGFAADYRILPFKGLYLYSSEPAGAFRTNVYPVPDLGYPFLGVHVTVTVDGRAKIGPTAIPCLWREQYDWHHGFRFGELASIAADMTRLALGAGFDFRSLAIEEMRKYHRPTLVSRAAALADGIRVADYATWGRPGIRAQLVDVRKRTLVQDFVLESDARSLHVLNAVSPGFTCALPFAAHVCDEVERVRDGHSPVTVSDVTPRGGV
jgi:L-2-hydroxyglutarate oxidase LhgO